MSTRGSYLRQASFFLLKCKLSNYKAASEGKKKIGWKILLKNLPADTNLLLWKSVVYRLSLLFATLSRKKKKANFEEKYNFVILSLKLESAMGKKLFELSGYTVIQPMINPPVVAVNCFARIFFTQHIQYRSQLYVHTCKRVFFYVSVQMTFLICGFIGLGD